MHLKMPGKTKNEFNELQRASEPIVIYGQTEIRCKTRLQKLSNTTHMGATAFLQCKLTVTLAKTDDVQQMIPQPFRKSWSNVGLRFGEYAMTQTTIFSLCTIRLHARRLMMKTVYLFIVNLCVWLTNARRWRLKSMLPQCLNLWWIIKTPIYSVDDFLVGLQCFRSVLKYVNGLWRSELELPKHI